MYDSSGTFPLTGLWVKLQQGSNWAIAQTGSDGFYLFYDGQTCDQPDSLAGGCGGASTSTWNFSTGNNVGTTVSVLGSGPGCSATTCPPAYAVPTYPAGSSRATVMNGNTSTTYNAPTAPTYSLNVTSGSGYNRDWKFS